MCSRPKANEVGEPNPLQASERGIDRVSDRERKEGRELEQLGRTRAAKNSDDSGKPVRYLLFVCFQHGSVCVCVCE